MSVLNIITTYGFLFCLFCRMSLKMSWIFIQKYKYFIEKRIRYFGAFVYLVLFIASDVIYASTAQTVDTNKTIEFLYKNGSWLGTVDKSYGQESFQSALLWPLIPWEKYNTILNINFSYAYIKSHKHNDINSSNTIQIISVGPDIYVFPFRAALLQLQTLSNIYIEGSIAPSYLTKTVFDNRDLGIHYSFKDTFGLGLKLNHSVLESCGVKITHYSNAHLSNKNRGITLPLLLFVGFKF